MYWRHLPKDAIIVDCIHCFTTIDGECIDWNGNEANEAQHYLQIKSIDKSQITNRLKLKLKMSMEAKEALQQCTIEGNIVKLPDTQLDRKAYLEVKKSLELIGGKWKGGKVQGFVFNSDPTELLASVQGGEKRNLKKEFQFFGTPPALAKYLVELADLQPSDEVSEPQAGQGAIVAVINDAGFTPDIYELMQQNVMILQKSGLHFNMLGQDFFKHGSKLYDKIIANPPFTKNQDIDHVVEMFNVLKPTGRLVSVTSTSWFTGSQKRHKAFRAWLDELNAEILDIEPGTFKESGTMVGGKIVVIDKDHNSASVEEIQKALGHKDSATTKKYLAKF